MSNRGTYYRWHTKDTVDSYLKLDIAQIAHKIDLSRAGVGTLSLGDKPKLQFLIFPDKGLKLFYGYRDQTIEPYMVRFTYTTPGAGGRRVWFLCPTCHRRCRILYGGHPFACRQCHNLTYPTRQQSRLDARQTAIRNRMRRIEERLAPGGFPSDAAWSHKLPDKPPTMQSRTYFRLLAEYQDLRMMDTWAFCLGVTRIVGNLANLGTQGVPDSMPEPESLATLNEDWRRLKRLRRQTSGHHLRTGELMSKMQSRETWWEATRPAWADADQSHARLTLGELASAAGVPYAFAKEAVAEELVRADGGRDTRTKRYRKRLATWLAKLYRLRRDGMAWTEIRAWSRRRFLPGHEHERLLPARAWQAEFVTAAQEERVGESTKHSC